MKKGLIVSIYRTCAQDCTNNGISAQVDRLVLTGSNIPQIFECGESLPEISIVERERLDGTSYQMAIPAGIDPNSHITMWGGNFIHSSDSRFPYTYPIPIHDRIES